jgi:hypothetical protein
LQEPGKCLLLLDDYAKDPTHVEYNQFWVELLSSSEVALPETGYIWTKNFIVMKDKHVPLGDEL